MSDKPNDVGQVLKAEREKRAMTLEVVHEATKIPLDSLRAIEEGYKIRTLSTFYYKSFIKIYAQYLGLDAHEILALVPGNQSASKKAVVEEAPKPKPRPNPRPAAVPAKPAAAPAVKDLNLFAGPVKKGHLKKAAVIVGGILAVVVVVFLVSTVVGSVRKHLAVQSALNPAKKKTTTKAVKTKSAPVKTVETAKKVVPAPALAPLEAANKLEAVKTVKTVAVEKPVEKTAQAAAPAVKTPKKATLAVRAPITVWLKVRVDGSTVYQGSLKKGNFESWSGSKKIELSGKGIAKLELEVNGKTVGKLGRPDVNAKKIIVTPEGMSVEK